MKKKVVQIVRAPAGGIRKHIISIVEGLEDRFEFYFVLSQEDGDSLFFSFLEEFPHYKDRILDIPIRDQPGLSDISNLLKIWKFINRVNADVVHGHGAKGGLYARLCTVFKRAKACYTAHGGALHSMHGKLKGHIFSVVEKCLYYLTDTIIFESLYTKEQYELKVHKQTKKFELAFNAIKTPENYEHLNVKEINKEVEIKLGSFGLLRKIKGHEIVLKAISQLIENGLKVSYVIYGTGEEQQRLKELSSELKIDGFFSIVNKVEDLDQAMKSLDIIVHPSLFESFGYVPLEANVNGVTVVSSLNGGLKQVMDGGACGFCYVEDSSNAVAAAIEEAINNQEERMSRFIHFKGHIKKNFLEDSFLNKMGRIYES